MPPLKTVLRAGAHNAAGAVLETVVRLAAARLPSASAPPTEPHSIFVLRNNDVGDLLAITPLFEALRRRFPQARIAAGVGSWNLEVLRHNPHLSEVLTVEAPWFNKYREGGPVDRLLYIWRSPQVREVAACGFEVGIDVLGSVWGSLLLLRAGVPYRLSVRGYAGGHSAAQATVRFNPGEHVGRTALRFAELLGATDLPPCRPQVFLTAGEREGAERWWATAEDGRGRKRRLVVAPGGGLAVKCWPPESWMHLLRGVAGRDDLSILILSGPRERELAAALAASCPAARVHPEPPGLRETFALIAASGLVVCNSSMPMHAAAAFERPTLVLLGPSFASASQHQAQWGYPTCRSLGRELPSRSALCAPDEALDLLREELDR